MRHNWQTIDTEKGQVGSTAGDTVAANVGTKQFETKRRKKRGTQPETKLEQSGTQVCDKELKR